MSARVLLVGLESAAVDFARWPELTVEKLEAAFAAVERALADEGMESRWCLVDSGATACDQLAAALTQFAPDVVSIGAGVRADPAHLHLFERMVNLVHKQAPQAVFAFNTDPMDTIASVRRAVRS